MIKELLVLLEKANQHAYDENVKIEDLKSDFDSMKSIICDAIHLIDDMPKSDMHFVMSKYVDLTDLYKDKCRVLSSLLIKMIAEYEHICKQANTDPRGSNVYIESIKVLV